MSYMKLVNIQICNILRAVSNLFKKKYILIILKQAITCVSQWIFLHSPFLKSAK